MRTKDEMRKYARGVAEGLFYSDEDTPWEPFEHWPKGQLEEEVDNVTISIYYAILWVQEESQT